MSSIAATSSTSAHERFRLTSEEGHTFELRPIRCPTCGDNAEQRVLGMRGGSYQRYGQGIPTRIVQCKECSLIFPNPFPYPLAVSELYGDPSKYFAAHDEAIKRELQRALVRDLIRRSRLRAPALLDVGSGRGELLRAAREEGLTDVVGLEVSRAMIEHAEQRNNVTVIGKTIQEYAAGAPRTFDIVVLNAVLEHVHDPNAMIESVAMITRRGSLVYIDVPNEPNLLTVIGNRLNRIRGRAEVLNLAPTWSPFHVFGFNRRALGMLLAKHGFAVEDVVIWAAPTIPSNGDMRDRARSLVATQINRVANHLRMASNMYVWARRM